MVKNKLKKLLISLFLVCTLFICLKNEAPIYALEKLDEKEIQNSTIVQLPANHQNYYLKFESDNYKPDSQKSTTGTSKLGDLGNSIIKIIRNIGSALSVIVLMIIAIKYMMGSVEEKAEYKKTMFPYVIGSVLVFGITNILAIIADIIV